ncbi:hypothetical protein DICPUDRAFT_85040 [Dictyostelium purpureum]|uniref:Lipoprotein n=1 Tax=Dictyostelium purpureum TaxID=5786 RepID=F1A4I2_DICPU|nr:uncharacterized protein DICPUDRAFT_85040 [Dictyostelium purpureum]EGC28899.1 hypothetical protein DICPUDRAFT_85040 [Dictyostelium purpureum]|eukprot:XP_003294576.1 hypothetical protein DICPUDRAFT_85040 [Dictyostelium purpureum]
MLKKIFIIFIFLLSLNGCFANSANRYRDYLSFNGMKTEFRAINNSGIVTITVEAIGLIDFNRSVSSKFPIKELIPNTHIATVITGTCNGSSYPLRVAFFEKMIFIQSLEPTVNDCSAIAVDPFTIEWVSSWN